MFLELLLDELEDDTSEDLAMKQEALLEEVLSLGDSNNDGGGVGVVAIATKLVAGVVSSSSSFSSPEEYSS